MTTDGCIDWDEVARIFDRVVDADDVTRDQVLSACGEDHPEIRREVEALLAAHRSASGFLQPPESGPPLDAPTLGVGTQLGAYRLSREIGRGGMGTVYLATRTDGAFSHDVAVKITRAAVTDRDATRRFALERQVLASLHHPNIVTLLDGGQTPSGQAYLVMEHVEGRPITDWFAEHATPLEGRLRLFRQVCSAVHAAHQHGVIHRDLKPANVLVTHDGVPKILDFGVAKLLDAPPGEATVTGLLPGPLTPNYASPEQLRGLPVTTASDVYSLGVLLFECLTGRRPHDRTGKPVDQVIADATRPTTARPSASVDASVPYPGVRLRGDLDAIVIKAMSVEPADRYASAEQLSDDVARHLGGRPVLAREPSLGYVLARLAGRHRAAVATAAVALVGVLAGLGVAIWQRGEALRARARAEAQFEDTRKLANAMLFRVHDAVADVPGTTKARQVIVSEAIAYLDRLASSTDDPALLVELARGYKQVGRVQGDPQIPNLGEWPAAKASFERAVALLTPLVDDARVGVEATVEAINVHRLLSQVARLMGNADASLAASRTALGLAEALVTRDARDEHRQLLGSANFNVALALQPREESLPYWVEAERLFTQLLTEKPDAPDRMRNVALVHKYVGGLLQVHQREDDAAERYQKALELDERRLAAMPDNHSAQFDVAIDLANLGNSRLKAGRPREALDYYERSVAMRERLVAADPHDVLARTILARVLPTMAWVQLDLGEPAAAARSARRALELVESLPTEEARRSNAPYVTNAWLMVAVAEAAQRREASACSAFERALRLNGGTPARADSDRDLAASFSRAASQLPRCPAVRSLARPDATTGGTG